jgi:NitT/TauT family transport system substrate-binding protein
VRFSAFPEIKDAFIGRHLKATFILAPLAISMREQGVPIKIVYLGHRDGTAMMVHKDADYLGRMQIEKLARPIPKGHPRAGQKHKIAIPSRFANQRLILYKAFKDRGLNINDVELVEEPPPDMPALLSTRAVDAVIAGEPIMAKTEMDGYGKVLFLTKDVWPDFISCVLAVHEQTIQEDRATVERMIEGIVRSGKWLDEKTTDRVDDPRSHRMQAAGFVSGKRYYDQDPRFLRFVLTQPPDRVKYTNLKLSRKDFEEIEKLGKESGILKGTARFEDYTDTSFVSDEGAVKPYQWEAKSP